MIIGLTGLAQSGKDTTAEYLVEKYNFQQISFAAPLKQMAYDIDPLITQDSHLATLVDLYGWDRVKTEYPEARRFLQRIGTEGLRKNVDDNFWVNLALKTINDYQAEGKKDFVISDMRFVNEYQTIKDYFPNDLTTIRIMRDGLVVMNHASELELNQIPEDFTLNNNGSIADLRQNVDDIVARIYSNK